MRYLLPFVLMPGLALADGFALLKDDQLLSRQEVVEMTQGHLVEFFEGGQSRYSAGGASTAPDRSPPSRRSPSGA